MIDLLEKESLKGKHKKKKRKHYTKIQYIAKMKKLAIFKKPNEKNKKFFLCNLYCKQILRNNFFKILRINF